MRGEGELVKGAGRYVVLVTAYEDIPIGFDDLRVSGAVFTRRGKPRNALARMMIDFLTLEARDNWQREGAEQWKFYQTARLESGLPL